MVSGIALVYGTVLHSSMAQYIPYVGVGTAVWSLIGTALGDAPNTLSGNAQYLTQSRMPISLFAFRSAARTLMLFGYRAVVIILAFLIVGHLPGMMGFLSIAGLAIIMASAIFIAIIFGILGARYRDLGPLINSFVPFMFLMTPVFWQPERLADYQWVVMLNPFFHYLQIVRGPLIGSPHLLLHFIAAATMTALLAVAAVALMRIVGRRIVFWL